MTEIAEITERLRRICAVTLPSTPPENFSTQTKLVEDLELDDIDQDLIWRAIEKEWDVSFDSSEQAVIIQPGNTIGTLIDAITGKLVPPAKRQHMSPNAICLLQNALQVCLRRGTRGAENMRELLKASGAAMTPLTVITDKVCQEAAANLPAVIKKIQSAPAPVRVPITSTNEQVSLPDVHELLRSLQSACHKLDIIVGSSGDGPTPEEAVLHKMLAKYPLPS